jgi:hypothetical protein
MACDAMLDGKSGLMAALVGGRYDHAHPDPNLGPQAGRRKLVQLTGIARRTPTRGTARFSQSGVVSQPLGLPAVTAY